ncbi:MAG: nitrile hydratase accessory protein [Candidatus Levyibacteriota bacterium]
MSDTIASPFASPETGDAPVFREPWEAHAFAMVVSLHQRGAFTWPEWADALAAEIAKARREGDADLGDTYYRHWLRALEALVARKGLCSAAELSRYRDAWDRAADRTPHGAPIELQPGDFPAETGLQPRRRP